MQDTAAYTKPISVNRFPLAASPQHIPDAVEHGACVCRRPAPAPFLGWLGKELLDLAPQGARNAEVVDILRLCDKMLGQDVSSLVGVWFTPIVGEIRL